MKRPLSILIVEDDPAERDSLEACFEKYVELLVVGSTGDEGKALELISSTLPDTLILDLALDQGSGGGIGLLKKLREQEASAHRPYILVTTNNAGSLTSEIARDYGADYIQSKRQRDYSPRLVADFLVAAKPSIQSRMGARAATESPKMRQKRIAARISEELDKVGISPKLLGRRYLEMGILLMIQQPNQRLCGTIAAQVGKSEASVDAAMKGAINRTWTLGDPDALLNYTARLDPERGVPTVTEFICHYADKIRREIE